jgi:hypothetical protein
MGSQIWQMQITRQSLINKLMPWTGEISRHNSIQHAMNHTVAVTNRCSSHMSRHMSSQVSHHVTSHSFESRDRSRALPTPVTEELSPDRVKTRLVDGSTKLCKQINDLDNPSRTTQWEDSHWLQDPQRFPRTLHQTPTEGEMPLAPSLAAEPAT